MPTPEPQAVPGYRAPQYAAADLVLLTPDEIVAAKAAGQLDRVIGVPPREVADRLASGAQLTRADLAGMSPDEVVAAKAAGRLDDLLGTTTPTADR